MNDRHSKTGKIYAVLFSNGLMKAGMSGREAAGRINAHCRIARLVGATKVAEIVVDVPFNTRACERALLEHCRSIFIGQADFGNEWFKDVPTEQFMTLRPMMGDIAVQSSGLAHSCPTEATVSAVKAFDGLFIRPQSKLVSPGDFSDPRYVEAVYLARLLQTMVFNEGISGEIFSGRADLGGISRFVLTLSIHLYCMDDEDRASCMRDVIDGIGDEDLRGLFEVIQDAETSSSALIRQYEESIGPEDAGARKD